MYLCIMYVYVCMCMCVSVHMCKVCTAFMWLSDKIIYPLFRSAWNFCDLICMYVCMYVCINVLCMYMYMYESVCMRNNYHIYSVCIHTYIRKYIHVYIHSHIHVYIHTFIQCHFIRFVYTFFSERCNRVRHRSNFFSCLYFMKSLYIYIYI